MKKISIVIPVLNEEQFIGNLLESIDHVNYSKDDYEVIVVSDGSKDRTVDVVLGFPHVRLIELGENIGRYKARKIGAEAARYPNVLFVDSRAKVDPQILEEINCTDARAINGYVFDAENSGPFEIFYRAIRRVVFHKFFRKYYNKRFYLTLENFDTMPKGTTVFFVEKEVLFRAYDALAKEDMGIVANDDVKLFKEIIQYEPILVHPGVRITHYYRPSFRRSVYHLAERGVKFTGYYLNPRLEKFWLVIILPLAALTGLIAWLLLTPLDIWIKIVALILLNAAVTLGLARSFREFGIIFYMAPLCISVFYSGVLIGVFRKIFGLFG